MTTKDIHEYLRGIEAAIESVEHGDTELRWCELQGMISRLERRCAACGCDVRRLTRSLRARLDRACREVAA